MGRGLANEAEGEVGQDLSHLTLEQEQQKAGAEFNKKQKAKDYTQQDLDVTKLTQYAIQHDGGEGEGGLECVAEEVGRGGGRWGREEEEKEEGEGVLRTSYLGFSEGETAFSLIVS